MKNNRDSEISFMLEVEKWLKENDINDEISTFEQLKAQSLIGYLSGVKNFLEWKASDLLPELNDMVNNFNKQQQEKSQNKDEEEIEK